VYVHKFTSIAGGIYRYHCEFDTTMKGSLRLDWDWVGYDSALIVISDTAYTPRAITLQPGAKIRWINHGAQVHTVTSR
jgi:plastocyanin